MPQSYYLDLFADGGGMPDRRYTLTGSSGSVAAWEQQIQGDIPRANQTGGMGGDSGGGQTAVEVMVPGNKVGVVIGKGGETIRQLQRRGGVKMVIIQGDNIPSALEKPLRISGDPHQCQRAKEMVLELLAEGEMKIPVPRTAVGVVIGKNGETIKRIQQESGAKVQFKADDGHSPERVCAITGSQDKVQIAAQMIQHLLIEYNREGGMGRGLGRGRGGSGPVRGHGEFGGGPGRGLGRGDGFRGSQEETQLPSQLTSVAWSSEKVVKPFDGLTKSQGLMSNFRNIQGQTLTKSYSASQELLIKFSRPFK
uniref:Far upstream element-binding protein 3-like isoform X3 n=1 Tax=Crassostrea virginica TaxID=6565 RepID=A0A8B8AE88_CRAVI|nr:far upstream element-binding protein 3-like isoform X3 [Crassostrea virginica]